MDPSAVSKGQWTILDVTDEETQGRATRWHSRRAERRLYSASQAALPDSVMVARVTLNHLV